MLDATFSIHNMNARVRKSTTTSLSLINELDIFNCLGHFDNINALMNYFIS